MGCYKLTYIENQSPLFVSGSSFRAHEKECGRTYDLAFRNYDAALGRFHQVDPLAYRDASTSPFAYAGNNPIRYNDPWGLLKATQQEFFDFINDALNGNGGTWSEDGGQHLFSDGEFAAMNASFGEGGGGSGSFLSANGDGTGTGLNWSTGGGQFSLTVSTGPINKYGGIWEGPNSTMNTISIDIPTGSLQEFATDVVANALDPSTVGQNLFGLSYPGGNNPMTYPDENGNRRPNYSVTPKSLAEYPAIGHDRRYDNLKINGASGLFFDTRAIGADWQFVSEELDIAGNSAFDPVTRTQSAILGLGLGAAALGKTLFASAFGSPGEIGMWYGISSIGVTNSPSK